MNPFAHKCKLKSCKMCSEMHAIDETPENNGVEETKHDQEDQVKRSHGVGQVTLMVWTMLVSVKYVSGLCRLFIWYMEDICWYQLVPSKISLGAQHIIFMSC